MSRVKINDRALLELIDKQGLNQSQAARELGVTRQAVNRRLREIRGRTTKAIVSKKIGEIVDRKIDAMEQLGRINEHATWLLEHVMKWIQGDKEAIQVLETAARQVNRGTRKDPEWVTEYKFTDPHQIALRAMSEIRAQLALQLEIFATLYDMKAVAEFQEVVMEIIGEVDADARARIIHKLNQKRSIRSAVRYH